MDSCLATGKSDSIFFCEAEIPSVLKYLPDLTRSSFPSQVQTSTEKLTFLSDASNKLVAGVSVADLLSRHRSLQLGTMRGAHSSTCKPHCEKLNEVVKLNSCVEGGNLALSSTWQTKRHLKLRCVLGLRPRCIAIASLLSVKKLLCTSASLCRLSSSPRFT